MNGRIKAASSKLYMRTLPFKFVEFPSKQQLVKVCCTHKTSTIILNGLTWISVPGSRSSLVNMEARPMTSDMLTRRCVVTRLSDLTIERFKEAIQSLGAGAMLILLPKNTSIASLEQMEVKKTEKQLLVYEIIE